MFNKTFQLILFTLGSINFSSSVLSQNLTPRPNEPPSFPEVVPKPLNQPPLRLPETPPKLDFVPISGSIKVTQFEFEGNTVFSNKELENLPVLASDKTIKTLENETLSFTQLIQIAYDVTNYYNQQGYQTSGAVIVIPSQTRTSGTGKVIVRVIEGTLEAIRIGKGEDLKKGKLNRYIAWRLGVDENEPLNVNRLLEALQLLQIDPRIETISAKLLNGTERGKNILEVSYNPASSFDLPITVNNGRSPTVGTIERGVAIEENNLLGFGDRIRVGYLNTDGSDQVDASYEIPFNAKNGSFRFDFTYSNNRVIESPFKDINNNGRYPDITSDYEAYDFTLRQPIIRSIQNQVFNEFALSLIGSWRQTQSFLFGEPFPLAISADVLGNTRLSALRFGQDYTRQTSQDILVLSSQLSWGLDAFGSTINEQISGVDPIADSRFVSWRFQGQYVRQLAPETLFLVRTNLQLSDRPLLPIEQFSSGGLGSVLGYRQDLLLTDNGFFIGTEFRVPILRITRVRGVLQVVPFINYGLGWNTDTISPEQNNLASVGLCLLWQMDDYLSARIDYGIPLIDVRGRTRTWQENGIYFTIRINPF